MDEDLLEEVLSAIVGNRKSRSDVQIIKRKLYSFIFLNVDLPDRNPHEEYPVLVDDSLTVQKKLTATEKLRRTVKNMGTSKGILSLFNQFKQTKNIFNLAFNPGVTKVRYIF
jgi:hypothetical protein